MDIALFWDKIAEKYSRAPIRDMAGYNKTLDRIRQILQPHHRVLEIGCGTGSTALELAGGVDRYVGTDISPKMIAIAQDKLNANSPQHLSFQIHDVASPSSGQHDIVIALNLLHLLPDLEKRLAAIFDELPQGGMLISKTALMKEAPWYLRALIRMMQAVGKAPYLRSLTNAELRQLLQETGFEITETIDQDGMVSRLFIVATKP